MNEPKKRGRPFKQDQAEPANEPANESAAQSYAERVWAGQNETVPRVERLRRVKLALDGQGLSFEGVQL